MPAKVNQDTRKLDVNPEHVYSENQKTPEQEDDFQTQVMILNSPELTQTQRLITGNKFISRNE